jgi:predicted RNA binding protein YcfA (HicA-like mRNA interferase family)
MTRKKKLYDKIMNRPVKKDITFAELKRFLQDFGYEKTEGEGSRVIFYHRKYDDLIVLHKPHPGNEVKAYIVKEIQNKIKSLFKE